MSQGPYLFPLEGLCELLQRCDQETLVRIVENLCVVFQEEYLNEDNLGGVQFVGDTGSSGYECKCEHKHQEFRIDDVMVVSEIVDHFSPPHQSKCVIRAVKAHHQAVHELSFFC